MSSSSDISSKIREQVEFYFSDSNLRRDKFLKQKISESTDGFVRIDVLLTFNRLRSISDSKELVAESLAASTILKLSEDKEQVARVVPFEEAALANEDDRTLFVNHVGDDATIDSVKEKFSKYGAINMVRIPRPRNPKGRIYAAFIVFASPDSVAKAVAELPKLEVPESRKFNRPMYALNMKGFQERKERKSKERKERKHASTSSEPKLHVVGNILRLQPLSGSVAFQDIAAILAKVQTAKFIDIDRENLQAFVRFKTVEEADEVVAYFADNEVMLHEQRLLCQKLDEPEQIAYWKNVEKNQKAGGRQQQRSKHHKGNKRQRDESKDVDAPTKTEVETNDTSATKKCKTEHADETAVKVEAKVKEEEQTVEMVDTKPLKAEPTAAAPAEPAA